MEALDHPGQRVAARPTLAAHAAHAASPLREIGNCFRDAPTPLWDLPTVLSHGARCCHMGRRGRSESSTYLHRRQSRCCAPLPAFQGGRPWVLLPVGSAKDPRASPRPSINCWGTIRRSSWLSPWLCRPADAQPRCWAILGRPVSLCLLGRWRRQLLAFTLAASAGRRAAKVLGHTG